MTNNEAKKSSRLRWVTLGEAIAIAALILSAVGLWHEWTKPDSKEVVVEKQRSIPLALAGRVANDGRDIEISPVENSHALQSLTVVAAGNRVKVGSGGRLSADDFAGLVGNTKDAKGGQRATLRITARYVEAGADKSATDSYVISYRWEGGGLFGGRHIRFEDFSR